MVTTVYAKNLYGGTISTSGSTLLGCTSIGSVNITGNAGTCTNFNNGTSSSSGGNVIATTFKGPVNTVVAAPSGGAVAINNGGGDTIFYGTSALTNCGDGSLPTHIYGTTITSDSGPEIMADSTPFSGSGIVDVPITIGTGESVDIRYNLHNLGTGQLLKIYANTATSITNCRTSSKQSGGAVYGTIANLLCGDLLEDNAGNCFTITVTKDSTYTLIYMSGVFMLNDGVTKMQAFNTFTGYFTGSMTNLRVKIDTGNIYGQYHTTTYTA
jgi:hypothetical protein